MDAQSKHEFRRVGVRVAEVIEAELELHGEDSDAFEADPNGYMKTALEQAGFEVREVKNMDRAIKGHGGVSHLYALYHIVWDRDRSAICMYTPWP
jgi:hypothetical protein